MKLSMLFLFFSVHASGISFNEALKILDKHESVDSILAHSKSIHEMSYSEGSWGDPSIKLSAKNLPINTFKRDETPMSGLEVKVMQKIALTTKYSKMKKSYESLSKAQLFAADDKKLFLTKFL